MLLMRAFKLRELPKSTLKDRVNNKEQNTEKLVSIRSYSKPVLSEADFRPFSGKRLCGRNWEPSIPNFANIAFFYYSLNKGLWYLAWSWFGTYHRCCSRTDGALG